MENVEMMLDSVRVALADYSRAVILRERDGNRYLVMRVGSAEAEPIACAFLDVPLSEPLAYGSVYSTMSNLRATLEHVVIYGTENKPDNAKALLRKDGPIEIRCRPSEAIAVALKARAPILVPEETLATLGISVSELHRLQLEARTE